jgi:CRP/FNR family transcriptional regulator
MSDRSLLEYRQAAIVATLRGCQIFSSLSAEDINSIAAITVSKSLNKGDYLFHQGDTAHGFYVVQRGSINIHRVTPAGKEQVIHVFRVGESFAEGTLATDTGYPADARAVETSQVLQIQKSGFLSLLRRHPELALKILASMALHLRVLVAQIEDLTLKDVETRLANWLIKRCPSPLQPASVSIHLVQTKRVLAAELGTVSETFSRTLAKFRELGLIRVKGKVLTVINPARLNAHFRSIVGG